MADQLGLSFLDKDDVLVDLLNRSADPQAERPHLSRRADVAFAEQAKQLPGAVLVSFWRRTELSATSGTPTDWLEGLPGLVELWCRCPPKIAVSRFLKRDRHPGHGDQMRTSAELLVQFEALERLGPLGIGRLIEVDTTTSIDVRRLAQQIDEHSGPRSTVPKEPSGDTR